MTRLEYLVFGFPFPEVVYPDTNAALEHFRALGRPAVLSDGDQNFQRHKIRAAGIEEAVDGHVLVYVHKELNTHEIMMRYPTHHYVMVDDKSRIHVAMKERLGEMTTTVHVCRGSTRTIRRITMSRARSSSSRVASASTWMRFSGASTAVLIPVFLAALLLVRGVPALLYRPVIGSRRTAAAALLQATSLPFIVAATQIGVEVGKLSEATAAAMVAAGLLFVLIFPVIAAIVLRGRMTLPARDVSGRPAVEGALP